MIITKSRHLGNYLEESSNVSHIKSVKTRTKYVFNSNYKCRYYLYLPQLFTTEKKLKILDEISIQFAVGQIIKIILRNVI